MQDPRSVFGAKDDMQENTGERLRQDVARINRGYILGTVKVVGCISQTDGVRDGSGFSALTFMPIPTQAVAGSPASQEIRRWPGLV